MSAPSVPAPTSGSPRQRAAADAAHIIASFPPPPGAVRSGLIAPLFAPGEGPQATPDVVTATRWWRVPGQPQTVLAWVRAHMPAAFTLAGEGASTYQPSPSITVSGAGYFQYTLPAVPDVLTARWLVVLAVPEGSNNTALRVDAQVVWLPAKPAAERIPQDARLVTVTPEINAPPNTPPAHLDHAFTVTSAAKVARIAAAIDRLPVYPPGDTSCGPNANVEIRLVFHASLRGQVVAVVDTNGPCAAVSVTIDGRAMPALSNFFNPLTQQVLKIAGVRWPYDPGAWDE